MTYALIAIIVAYLIGSLSFAVIISKLFNLPDPHTYGIADECQQRGSFFATPQHIGRTRIAGAISVRVG